MFVTPTLNTDPVISDSLPQNERVKAAADQFERIFVQQMVQAMRSSVSLGGDEGGMFGSGPGAGTFEDWFDTHLSRHLSETGGIGIGDMLVRNWQQHGVVKTEGEGETNQDTNDNEGDRPAGGLDVHA